MLSAVAQTTTESAGGIAAQLLGYLTVWNLLAFAGAMLLALVVCGKVPLRYNVRNLTIRWKTTIMTALAFTAVISLLTVMMAFVNGLRKMTENTGQPGNVLVLSDGATDEIISNLTVGDLAEIENLPAVEREGGRPLSSRETFLVVNQPVPSSDGRPKRRFLQLRGIEDPQLTARVHNLELLPGGSWFSEAGVQEAPHGATGDAATPLVQAVLGEGVAHEFSARPKCRRIGPRTKSEPARRRRHIRPSRSRLAGGRRAEIERHDVQFGDLGETLARGRAVRQGNLHDARSPYKG